MPPPTQPSFPAPGAGIFATTRWSVVLAAGSQGQAASGSALEELCRIYWGAVRAFIRKSGRMPEDAEDLTQEFFARLLARRDLARVDPGKGRFRNFLLVSVRHFLADDADKARALKRGGGQRPLSLQAQAEDGGWPDCPDPLVGTPEQHFDRHWAQALLQRARARLREECVAAQRLAIYEALGPETTSDSEEDYAEIGARLGMSVGGVKSAAFRLRRRYRELIRLEVAETVSSAQELEEEIRHLLRVLAG